MFNVANLIISIILVGGLLALVICLQIWLSKRQSKWYGLILPIISFTMALLTASSILLFSMVGNSVTTTVCTGGGASPEVCRTEVLEDTSSESVNDEKMSIIVTSGAVFLIYNIPTGIYLLIYRNCRKSLKEKNDLSKMAVLDL